ncbi:hypothetical protein VZT92_016217 [Zoarces viviparus]|uniref:Uncharacterized protein n=1 Tax=Zoarces viviparus TaxID=48416 RepID=A0AAW1ET76_ZOAVI
MSCPSATARHGAFERGYPRRLRPDCPAPGPDHRAVLPHKRVELAGLTSLDVTIPAHHSEEQRTGFYRLTEDPQGSILLRMHSLRYPFLKRVSVL